MHWRLGSNNTLAKWIDKISGITVRIQVTLVKCLLEIWFWCTRGGAERQVEKKEKEKLNWKESRKDIVMSVKYFFKMVCGKDSLRCKWQFVVRILISWTDVLTWWTEMIMTYNYWTFCVFQMQGKDKLR